MICSRMVFILLAAALVFRVARARYDDCTASAGSFGCERTNGRKSTIDMALCRSAIGLVGRERGG